MNHLEELLAEWYDYKGYFVRRNVKVGPRSKGGYEGELDIVAFDPEHSHLVHIEVSSDANSWEEREKKYSTKFRLGKEHIPKMFQHFNIPDIIDQRAVFLLASKVSRTIVGSGTLYLVSDYIKEIKQHIQEHKPIATSAIPEQFPLLRTLQLAFNLNLD